MYERFFFILSLLHTYYYYYTGCTYLPTYVSITIATPSFSQPILHDLPARSRTVLYSHLSVLTD